ncbi:MAG TPA: SdrD B-like domain-containing protein [Anaerolineae bacterium]|nr:SdrD B-like domain-containing protein [Anaerolineae bacterium]
MKTQSFASRRRSPAGRHVVFAGRVLAAIGMIVLLTLTSWSPAMPLALAQDSAPPTEQPGGDLSAEAPTAPDAVTAGGAGYIYALTAKDSKLFYRYDISANTWAKMADIPANVQWGGALTTDGTYIYALSAKDTQGFYRYDIAANTWSARANVPAKVKEGGALTYDGTYVYALTAKDSKLFYRYSNSANSWSAALTAIPSNVQKTGALNRLGSYIYALPSKDTQFFNRYDIAAGTWATQANVPAKVKEGGALTNDGTYVYALSAKDSKLFYRYDVAANSWTKRADLPAIVTKGGALTYDGAYIYALRAGDSQSFYRYNIAANTWSTQANIPAKVKEGGALVFVPPASSVTLTPNNQGLGVPGQERIYAHTLTTSNLTSVFNLTTTSDKGWPVTVYKDVNEDGDKDPEDTAITATPSIGPNATFKLLVGVQVPLGAGPGVTDTTTVTATAVSGGATASATNTTQTAQAGQEITVLPNFTRNVAPGMVSFYGHTVTNNGGQAQQVTITATSSQGWTVLLWEDTNQNGVHETNNPNEPAVSNPVSLAPGQTYWLVAEIQTPANAAIGTVDQTVIRVDGQNGAFGTATDTSTVISAGPPVVDGKYDDIYDTSPNSTVVCYNDTTGKNFGKLASYYLAGSDAVYVVLAIDKDFVDNTYGVNAIGWPNGHTFGNLVGSDHALFYGYGANGTKVLDFKSDYITANPSGTTTPSNYSTLGVLGGDGRMNLGSAASIPEWGTSIDYSLNDLGYCAGGNCAILGTNLVVNSPATDAFYTPNATYPDWIYDVIYELKINTNAFPGGFGRMEVPYIHASPSKIGTNTIIPVPGECPGEIGDYVWHDANRDQVQDSNEQGIDNVRVELYKDDGDGVFESSGPNGDSFQGFKTTTAGGKYLFQDLKAGDYWVYVVESTVPAGYTTTTYNSPMLVNLGEGESYLDADFGYAIPSTLDYGDAPDGGGGTAQGNYNTTNSDNGPRHTIVGAGAPTPLGQWASRVEGFSSQFSANDWSAAQATGAPNTNVCGDIKTAWAPNNGAPASIESLHLGYTTPVYATGVRIRETGERSQTVGFVTGVTLVEPNGTQHVLTIPADSAVCPGYFAITFPQTSYLVDEVIVYTVTPDNGYYEEIDAVELSGYVSSVVNTLKLGNVAPDGDSGFLQNVDATADDLTNVQDEDGVAVLPQILETSTSVDLTVRAINTNSAGTPATLACWIDFNRNGVFENNFERASTTVPANSGTADYVLPFSNLSGLVAGDSYLRCRIAYEASEVANPTGAANSGEVEDYKVTIGPQPDYGDAPDADQGTGPGNYQTRAADGGPSHVIVNNLRLGALGPDGDNGTLQNGAANADDTTNTDDEDGVNVGSLPVIYNTTTSVPVSVSVFNNTGADATVACWIDFNRDGDFGDTGERQSAIVFSAAGPQTANLTFSGFVTPVTGNSYLRCRVANDAGQVATAVGAANSGEVEDYPITILGLDYGDAPDTGTGTGMGNYNTTASDGGPSHVIVSGLVLGSIAPDADPGTLQDVDALADDSAGIDDEDGVETLPSIDVTTTSVPLVVKATNAAGANALLACWIDFNRNGLFEIAERATATVPDGIGTQTVAMTFSGFGTPVAGDSYLRCRIASNATEAGSPTGPANSGEVEDYKITIAAQQLDFGDAPDGSNGVNQGNYNTTLADNGPRHVIVDGIRLGVSAPDGDDGTLQNEDADADDTTGIPDEDGVTAFPVIETTTQEVPLTVLANNDTNANAFLVCWIDFNRDGDFLDGGEKSSQATVPAGGADAYEVYFTGFAAPVEGGSYLRCRIASSQGDVQSPTGLAQSGEVEDYPVFIAPGDTSKVGQIGNFVWVDENSDGYQDAGEPGIPNVTVVLYGLSGQERGRTVTDAHGHYLFSNLPGGTYYVDVFDGTGSRDYTLPRAGMEQTPPSTLPGADYGNQDHNQTAIPNTSFTGYRVKLDSGAENLTADFGYNYNTAPCVNNDPSCTDYAAALGDRVWIDANGDGKQDPEEVGLSNVTLTLYYDPDGNGVYDTIFPGGTATTNAAGYYIFDQLPPGAYVVQVTPPGGYTQTGDPDLWGAWCSTACDNQTTTPVILAPGDVFLNVDFGYQPPASQSNTIGDKVWFDADADGNGPSGAPGGTDTAEYGIAGVTVALIRDLNNNGIWNVNEPIVATDTTDASGVYLFTGLPDGSYLVWVNDTSNVLAGLSSTYDSDGGVVSSGFGAPLGAAANTVRGISWVQNLGVGNTSGVTNLLQDFGYTPINQQPNLGLIGDRVWLDPNGDGVQNTTESGLEGVVVTLLNSGGTPIAATKTDENGYYYFPNLSAGTYTVVVTQPGGMTQTYDADGLGTPNRSTVTIGPGGINLLQDFGYRGTGTIGNLVWEDLNANGVVDSGEAPIPGVTLVLYWDLNGDGQVDPGEPLISQATTGSLGGYLFSGLPTDDGDGNANFVVRVTDDKGLLLGYWHSLGAPKADNNSQTDPYAVALTPGVPNNLTADFGYYIKPAALGNRTWSDNNSDGIQGANEPGLAAVKVTLTIQYNSPSSIVVTTSDDTGFYSFGNLLLDEDHAASSKIGAPLPNQPLYTLSTATPSGYTPSPVEALGSTSMNDSDNHAGVNAWATQGQTNVTPNANPNAESNPIAGYDFGFHGPPLAVLLASFDAAAQPDHVLVTWETVSEANNAGFNLYRSLTADGDRTLLGYVPSQAPGSTAGAAYTFQDFDVAGGQGYWYVLEDIDLSGATALHGPVSVVFQAPTAVTLSALDADAGPGAAPWMVLLALLALIAAAMVVVNRRRVTS